ncbi:uncharacterized protein ARMOST_00203 [Armillaria ostoyae]|uniref:Uncharacterized protein n=1 Tax=Armillaria ostoyae TaxID=47428 RepID=A0A284QKG4_ARMOS|nr:uncharacterized protein ARMOST_00203 [Armillaria ostoyae]
MEDGYASLLISHIVEDIQRPRSVVNDEALGHLSMMTAERSNEESREECDSETSCDDESPSETSYELTEAFTDLSLLSHPTSLLMPTFSLLGATRILLFFHSFRSTWGISEPAIGIILSDTGFVGRVVLGCLDKVCPDPEVLSAIRFAYGDETRTDASLGVYDLTDPLTLKSAERGRLQSQAEPAPRVLPGIGLVQPQKPSLAAAQSDGRSSKTGKTGKRAKSAGALSCSALGAKSLAGISPTATLSFSSYAHDRKIISLSNIPLGPDASITGVDAPTEINEMLKFYEDQTSYMKSLSKRHAFLHLLALVPHAHCFQNELLMVDNGVEEVILGHLSSLLWALVGGYSKQLAGKSPTEAGARHDWNVLLNFGSMAAHELASGRVVLERAVLLSRNIAAYVMMTSPDSDGAEFKTFVLQMYTIALQQAAYTPDTVSPSVDVPSFILQSGQFVPIAAQQLQDVQHLFRNSKKGRKAILKRASDEPELGIVDAILTVPSERMQLVPEPLIRVAEFRATFQASTRALSADNIVEPEEELAISEECAQTPEHLDFPVQAQNMHESKPAWVDRRRSGRSWSGVSATDGKKEGHWWGTAPLFCRDMLGDQICTRDVLFAEYKKPTQTYAKALVQAKMYLEASVRYLASLEVTKKAVFALATDGVEGAVLMAWCSGNLETVYIVERNVLLRLREYGDATLKEVVEAALNAEDFKQTSWNKTAQFNRMESG